MGGTRFRDNSTEVVCVLWVLGERVITNIGQVLKGNVSERDLSFDVQSDSIVMGSS